MESVEKFKPFVKSQATFHERQAMRLADDERRSKLHSDTAQTFRELLAFLECTEPNPKTSTPANGIHLSWAELQDLPDELMQELSVTDSDKLDYSIVELIEKYGGSAALDRILVELYRLSGEVMKRTALNARLYRMMQKGMLFGVPGKKGVYSTHELTEEEILKLNKNA